MRIPLLRTASPLFLAALLFAAWPAHARRYGVEQSQTLEETLRFAGASDDNLLVVDNINGSIRVTGYDGDEVRMVAREVFRARSEDHMERARREAGLAVKAEGSTVRLVVDGPFRRADGSIHWNDDLGYELQYDFEIRVPRRTRLDLANVNGGDVVVEGVETPDFDVSNVNGAVELTGVAGHGRAITVNGGIDVSFLHSPSEACHFRTVNGNVDVRFPDDLAADVRFKTFNGEVFTDFDYTPQAVQQPRPEKRGSRTVWKSLGASARIGGGGPEIAFETLNGNVYIRNNDR